MPGEYISAIGAACVPAQPRSPVSSCCAATLHHPGLFELDQPISTKLAWTSKPQAAAYARSRHAPDLLSATYL